jgi:AcrR family transcriptional regulator
MNDSESDRAPDNVDDRVRRSKQTVLATTFQLMQEGGIGGVSIDEVSRRSGVSKTTIYRHWSSRAALLLDACSKLRPKGEVPDTGSLHGDVTAHLVMMAHRLQTAGWTSILPSIIDAAERDPELADLHARMQAGFKEPLVIAIERAKSRGELAARDNTSDIVAALVGPLVYRRWFSREPIEEQFVKGIIANVLSRAKPSRRQTKRRAST